MNGDFKNNTTKEKLAKVVLACLNWGTSIKWSEDNDEITRKLLKLQYSFDPLRVRSCIDLIEDTENAIRSYSTFGLQKFSESHQLDLGEAYLKLYGILNAIQQQKLAIIELFETFKIENKNSVKLKLDDLTVIEIRNVVGAHKVNLVDKANKSPENFNTNFFRIIQNQLNHKGDSIKAVDGFGNIKEYNLYDSILEYNETSEIILYEGVISYLNKIFKNAKNKKDEILTHYEIIKFENFDYKNLYENDKLKKDEQKKWSALVKKELGEVTNLKFLTAEDAKRIMNK
ncbi:MAG: hypothetical protein K9I94_08415 [Bacteroidales bacterium]|nr:hypothetical protein [Bacteroidales bacterium]